MEEFLAAQCVHIYCSLLQNGLANISHAMIAKPP